LVGIWATPDLTVGRLLFAGAFTAYILIGLYFEERALLRSFGDRYREYRTRVPMLVPIRF
jgi:protein-S-isoprenylcysteine O-methyltransferase Ste14